MLFTILGSFYSFFNREGADIWPQIRPRKLPGNRPFIMDETGLEVS